MQQLIEKYNQAFEDAPLVQMSTLTYETPQGLRIWGGRLVKEKSKAQVQPAEPPPPLEDELRRKYLTQVDALLPDEERPGDGDDAGEPASLVPAPASPAGPPHGRREGPMQRASSPGAGQPSRPCAAGMAVAPRTGSPSLEVVGGDGFVSGQGCAADVCNATLSDLYAGMLHSMSRLLAARPSCVISTKTFALQNWGSRRRCRCRLRLKRTVCRGGRHAGKRPRETPSPPSEPGAGRGALRDRGNLPAPPGPRRAPRPGSAALQACRPSQPAGADGSAPTGPSQVYSSWTFLEFGDRRRLDQENRFMTLKWLISPVKVVSRPRIPGEGRSHCREIKVKFEKLHREFCRSPGNQPGRALPPASPAVDMPRGGPESPVSSRSLGTQQSGTAPGKTTAKRLCRVFGNLGEGPVGVGGGRPIRDAAPSPASPGTARGPGHSRHSSDPQGSHLWRFRMLASPSKALSLPRPQPGDRRARYNEIKEKFDQLHEKYRAELPEGTEAPPRPGRCAGEARMHVQYQQEGAPAESGPGSGSPEPRKRAPAWWSLKGPLCPGPIEVQPSTWFVTDAQGRPPCPAKRRRLSDPQVCGRWAEAPDSWRVASGAVPRPRKAGTSSEPGGEETKAQHLGNRNLSGCRRLPGDPRELGSVEGISCAITGRGMSSPGLVVRSINHLEMLRVASGNQTPTLVLARAAQASREPVVAKRVR
ncbi:PREDICTED: Holliday junction recognition protein [Condylura cristata]|uniref:Holliday junction recognition protein n=1 Tax=Condylura cristata TaxID=143302 RepID=UPI0006431C83|nr:PREDICTED: Holliday junction recognition protein [Condylura cristata]